MSQNSSENLGVPGNVGWISITLTLVTTRFGTLPCLDVKICFEPSAGVVLQHIQRVVVHGHIFEINRVVEQRMDARHAVISLPDDDRLASKEPVKLNGKARAAFVSGALLFPIALPAHDFGGIDEKETFGSKQQAAVGSDDVGQIASPAIQDRGRDIAMSIVPSDVPHEGVLPGSTSIAGEAGVVADGSTRDHRKGPFHLV